MSVITLRVGEQAIERAKNLPPDLGMVLHNIAVMLAPIDTGNLRTSIFLTKNTTKNIEVEYNHLIANYSKFLDEGRGPVKKYKGFISVDTHMAFVDTIVGYIIHGVMPPDKSPPMVKLSSTSNIFSWEKDMLLAVGKNSNHISPNVRRSISMIRELNYRKSRGISDLRIPTTGRVGTYVERTKINGKFVSSIKHGSNIGNSELRNAYNRLRKQRW